MKDRTESIDNLLNALLYNHNYEGIKTVLRGVKKEYKNYDEWNEIYKTYNEE